MNYRLTDRKSILHALEKAREKEGKSGGKAVRIRDISADENVSDSVILRFDATPGEEAVFIFKENLLKVRLQGLTDDDYAVKDIVIESSTRGAERIESSITVTDVTYAPLVDIASSIALYGKTSNIARACQMMRMFLVNHLNARGFLVSDVAIGFFYATDNELLYTLEQSGDNFFLIDALSKQVLLDPGYGDPTAEWDRGKRDPFFQRYTRESTRSQYIFPFRDQVENMMGYIDIRSTIPWLGNSRLGSGNQPNRRDIALLRNYLLTRSEELVFQFEIQSIKNWARIANQESLLDVSQNGRGAKIRISSPRAGEVMKKGAKIQFSLSLKGVNHIFACTIRNIREIDGAHHVGLRINQGSTEDSLKLLAAFARAQEPGV